MSGAGIVVGTVQRLGLDAQNGIALQMFFIAPALIILFSKRGRLWHQPCR